MLRNNRTWIIVAFFTLAIIWITIKGPVYFKLSASTDVSTSKYRPDLDKTFNKKLDENAHKINRFGNTYKNVKKTTQKTDNKNVRKTDTQTTYQKNAEKTKTQKNDEKSVQKIETPTIDHKDVQKTETQTIVNKDVEKTETQIIDPIEAIRQDCGQLCNTSRPGITGMYFNHVTAPIDCPAIFRNEYIDRTHGLKHAPKKMPENLKNEFTMNGRVKVYNWYFDQPYLEKSAYNSNWTLKLVNDMLETAKTGKLNGNYGWQETNALRDGLQHAPGVKNGRVLVIGSEIPWVEACVLEAGAKEIVTLEYGEIKSEHPQIKPITPLKFRKQYLNNELGKFDAVVTFSSVEHSGLGRYGDALNPWGDILAIARSWCVTKDGGSLTIGVMYDYNNDNIHWNAGRWYGKIRFPYLATNWKQLYRGQGVQRVYVFTKGETESQSDVTNYLREPHPYTRLNNTNTKFSQAKQDQTVFNIFAKKNGFFVEMGANDGQSFSNTLWLERQHNWTGLLVEADPDLCDQIDYKKRWAWRFCGCISSEKNITFIKGGALGSAKKTLSTHQMKFMGKSKVNDPSQTVIVPCFTMDKVLKKIGQRHIDYFSLDVEGAELFVLNTMKNDLRSGKITVDIWSIEYRVYDGRKIIIDQTLRNIQGLRTFFQDVGGYVEHSKLSNAIDTRDEMALDVVFVSVKRWCKNRDTLPNGAPC